MDIVRSTETDKAHYEMEDEEPREVEDGSLQPADGSPYEAHIPKDSASGETLKSYIRRV